jgi:hypothetical protein
VPWLLAWAGLCYGLFLAAGTPAALVLPRVQGLLEPLVVAEVEGTLLQGRAGRVSTPTVSLGDVSWSLAASALLRGCVALEVGGARLRAREVSLCADGAWRLRDAEFQLEAAAFRRATAGGDGRLRVRVDEAERGPEAWRAARGEATWSEAVVQVGKPLRLGTVSAVLGAEDGALVARVGNRGGDAALEGDARLGPDGRWSLAGRIDAVRDAETDRVLRALLGAPREGAIALRLSGGLPR